MTRLYFSSFPLLFFLLLALLLAFLPFTTSYAEQTGLEWHGYTRAGFTSNNAGSSASNTTFKDPNAGAFYRLGGGESNYSNWSLSQVFNDDSGAWGRVEFGLVYEDRETRSWVFETQQKTIFMDRSFIEMRNLDFAPKAHFWAGRMNYGTDIHILDKKFWEVRATGAGIKNYPTVHGESSFFLVAHESDGDNEYTGLDGNSVNYPDEARPRTHTFGVEHKSGNWWFASSIQSNSNNLPFMFERKINGATINEQATAADTGWQFMLHYKQPEFIGGSAGSTRIIAQYAQGISAALIGRNGDTNQSNEDGQNARVIFETMNNFKDWDLNSVALIQTKTDVDFDGSEQNWWTLGFRPINYLSQHLAMQYELGHSVSDYRNNNLSEKGSLTTLTLAPTLKFARHFSSRPEIRLYTTVAHYQGDYSAAVIDGYDDDEEYAFTWGVQGEIWF